MPARAKRLEYAVDVDAEGTAASDRGGSSRREDAWAPEHRLLEALARCTLASLAYHARRASLALRATAAASGTVAQRPDGTWGFVEISCRMEAELEQAPDADRLPELVARAERGCFVGASLDPRPVYRWLVNGAEVDGRG